MGGSRWSSIGTDVRAPLAEGTSELITSAKGPSTFTLKQSSKQSVSITMNICFGALGVLCELCERLDNRLDFHHDPFWVFDEFFDAHQKSHCLAPVHNTVIVS